MGMNSTPVVLLISFTAPYRHFRLSSPLRTHYTLLFIKLGTVTLHVKLYKQIQPSIKTHHSFNYFHDVMLSLLFMYSMTYSHDNMKTSAQHIW